MVNSLLHTKNIVNGAPNRIVSKGIPSYSTVIMARFANALAKAMDVFRSQKYSFVKHLKIFYVCFYKVLSISHSKHFCTGHKKRRYVN